MIFVLFPSLSLSLFLFLLFRAIRDILPVIIINKIISLIITPNLRRLNSGKRNVIVISTGIRTHARACIRQSTEYCDFFLFPPIFFRRRFSSSVLWQRYEHLRSARGTACDSARAKITLSRVERVDIYIPIPRRDKFSCMRVISTMRIMRL